VSVADASLLPSPCGVGPSWTIMALSRSVAEHLAADHSVAPRCSAARLRASR
jgi:choline dehydrogenase-like flavoprotein